MDRLGRVGTHSSTWTDALRQPTDVSTPTALETPRTSNTESPRPRTSPKPRATDCPAQGMRSPHLRSPVLLDRHSHHTVPWTGTAITQCPRRVSGATPSLGPPGFLRGLLGGPQQGRSPQPGTSGPRSWDSRTFQHKFQTPPRTKQENGQQGRAGKRPEECAGQKGALAGPEPRC